MVAKIFKLAAVPASLVFTSYGLYAVSDREPKGNLLSPVQLSIYSVPAQKSKYIEEHPGRLQSGFSSVRETIWPFVIWGKHFCSSVRNGVEDTVQFGKDSYVYLKNPPPEFLARLGIITVSGLAGLVLARKGSRLKKIAYPLGLTALGISVCYPTQAVIFAKLTGRKVYAVSHRTYDTLSSFWKANINKAQTQTEDLKVPVSVTEGDHHQEEVLEKLIQDQTNITKDEDPEPLIVVETELPALINEEILDVMHSNEGVLDNQEKPATVPSDSENDQKFKPDPSLLDHGQANPEDVDMYSTRS
ncbi:apolipoprotein O-like L homeolog [Xenopus laevis]|uniref:MICOS complex subunit n=1 Tax=Xenopus laevis TaxID=8355 RepID=Q3KQH5_XENLA|nr:apolipoprotein O-like L homeolog [Xenopus laevis]AAI06201.1 LOC494692 protein [Xenopus laevis]